MRRAKQPDLSLLLYLHFRFWRHFSDMARFDVTEAYPAV
jgi:hypothetical protein